MRKMAIKTSHYNSENLLNRESTFLLYENNQIKHD